MKKLSLIISGLIATIALLILYPAAFYAFEFLVVSVALLVLLYRRKRIPANVFPWLLLILIDFLLGSFAWFNAYYPIIAQEPFHTICWISSSIVSAFAMAFLFEVLMTDSIQVTLFNKIAGIAGVGLIVALIVEEKYLLGVPLKLIVTTFAFTIVLISFLNAVLNKNSQKARIRKDILYFIGPCLVLLAMDILLVFSGLFHWDYDTRFQITALLTGPRIFLILSFLAIVVNRYFPLKKVFG